MIFFNDFFFLFFDIQIYFYSGVLEGDVVTMTPILDMRHTTPMNVRRRSVSHPATLFGSLERSSSLVSISS